MFDVCGVEVGLYIFMWNDVMIMLDNCIIVINGYADYYDIMDLALICVLLLTSKLDIRSD